MVQISVPAKETRDGAPACGLYLRIDPAFNFEETVKLLRDVFLVTTRSAYKRNMHVLEVPAPADKRIATEVSGLVELAQHHGFVAILRGHPEIAKEFYADGVLLEDAADIPAARAVLVKTGSSVCVAASRVTGRNRLCPAPLIMSVFMRKAR